MYGKIFEDIFCSTLMDFGGDTAYVFIAMIVLSDENGIIKHTAESLARMICKDAGVVRQAIAHLEAPDQSSNLKAHEGRRIVPLCWINNDETRGWLVVNKEHYRDKGSKVDRKDYMREYMRKLRNENKTVNSGKQLLAQLGHTDTDTDTDTSTKALFANANGAWDAFWSNYPNKANKETALKRWKRLKAEDVPAVMASLEAHRATDQWRRGVIPHAATWLNQRRWKDELQTLSTLGECTWNVHGNREDGKPKCDKPATVEKQGLAYCKEHGAKA